MNAKLRTSDGTAVDPDDAPELTEEWFEQADFYIGDKLIRRGRPAGSSKTSTTIRLDDDILDAFKATGPRWQTRLNAAVRDWLKTHSPEEVTI